MAVCRKSETALRPPPTILVLFTETRAPTRDCPPLAMFAVPPRPAPDSFTAAKNSVRGFGR